MTCCSENFVLVPKDDLAAITQNILDLQVDVDALKVDVTDLKNADGSTNETVFISVSDLEEFGTESTVIYITDAGKEGLFTLDPTDTTSQTNTGTILVANGKRYKRASAERVNVKWFGAKGNGVADDTLAIQRAVNFVGNGTVTFPRGRYIISQTIDVTNTREDGTINHDGISITGDSMYSTILLGRTASSAIIDMTGSQFAKIADISLQSDANSPLKSQVGLYTGIFQKLPQTQNQVYQNLFIYLHNDPTANGNNGTIAFWNFGAEENTHDHIYYVANRPMLLTAYNSPVYPTPKQPLLESHSVGVTTFTGECFLQSVGDGYPALQTTDINSLYADNLYIHGAGNAGAAIQCHGTLFNSRLRGTIEGYATFLDVYGLVTTSYFDFQIGNITNPDYPAILLREGQGWIENTDIKLFSNVATRKLFKTYDAADSQLVTCYLSNVTVKTNFSLPNAQVPAKVLFHEKTKNVFITTPDYPVYEIVNRSNQKTSIPEKQIRGNSNSFDNANVIKVILPKLIPSISGQSLLIEITGMLSMHFFQSSGISTRKVSITIPIAVNAGNGSLTSVVEKVLGTQMATNPSGNSIDDVTVTANLVTETATNGQNIKNEIVINFKPTISGTNNEAVNFAGVINMYCTGNASDSPSILLL